jgi:hypothetical protein
MFGFLRCCRALSQICKQEIHQKKKVSTPLVAFAISLAARARDRASEGREAASERGSEARLLHFPVTCTNRIPRWKEADGLVLVGNEVDRGDHSGTVEQEGHEWMNELIWGGFSVCLNAKEKVLHS